MARFFAATVALLSLEAGLAQAQPPPLVINEFLLSTGGSAAAQFVEVRSLETTARLDGERYYVEIFDPSGVSMATAEATGLGGGAQAPEYYVLASTQAEGALGFDAAALLDVFLPAEGQLCFMQVLGGVTTAVHCIGWGCVLAPVRPGSIAAPTPPDGQSTQRPVAAGDYALAAPTPGALNAAGTTAEPCPERDGGPPPPLPDAGPLPDGGSIFRGGGGCGCAVPFRRPSGDAAWLVLAALYFALRHRRPRLL
jgi:hypothetical protein